MTNIRTIQSLQNPLIKHLVKVRQNRDYRNEHQSLILEGIKPILEVAQHSKIKRIVTIDLSLIPKEIAPEEILLVDQAAVDKISGLQHSPGILAEIAMPAPSSLSQIRFLLVVDHINDPGNLGALIRSALAFGWEGVFILNQSCDIFNDKCLRAARGSTFRLPYALGSMKDLAKIVSANDLTVWVADIAGASLAEIGPQTNIALVLSHESGGAASGNFTNMQKITIPMPGPMESLNVAIAGSILLYSLKK